MDGKQRPIPRNFLTKTRLQALLVPLVATIALLSQSSTTPAEEAQWIWASGSTAEESIPEGATCLFRKAINLRVEATGKIEIAADDQYELFINGTQIGSGSSSRRVDEYDISRYLQVGRNMVAVRVVNAHGDTAALMARVSVKPNNSEKWYTFSSDNSWKTTTETTPLWETVVFNDNTWGKAASFGALGETAPWDREEHLPVKTAKDQSERFQIQRGFGVQRVLNGEKIGSVIAMTFNEFGHLLLSQEGGPLLLVYDQDEDGVPETVRTYCDKVKSCHGILALNGDVFVTADGPEGGALYRLSDADRNGSLEKVQAIVKFKNGVGEHGAHGLRLGPDGMIYIVLGSHTRVLGDRGDGETYRDPYEGDLVARYEDPSGHGRGIKAPGGTVIRTNTDGSVIETVAGGLRNAYDVVFHPAGGMFVHDSDMEADIETAWYRPNAIFDVTEGGEFGWRTGWAKWPEYYLDRLPNLLDTGRGSPTGGVCYEHYMFPIRYQNTLFMADWSEGRILNVKLKPRGAGYVADSEVFLQGQPLNVTDLEVGPDGALYFCTGGRATAGGVYRVVYKGKIPERMKNLGSGIASAVRQPQIESAWTRQKIASIKREIGDQWNQLVAGVAYSNDNPAEYRVRAMTLMQLFGPVPSEDLLLELSKVESEQVRAKAATMLGNSDGPRARMRLVELLADDDPHVQRAACESMLRGDILPRTTESLMPLLGSNDRTLAFVARRVLERMPVSRWRKEVLNTADARIAIVGMLGLVNADPRNETAIEVLKRCSEMMTGFMSDADFTDVLRLCQVALHRGKVKPSQVKTLGDQVAEEFPAGEQRINHEVIRLAAYLNADSLAGRAVEFLDSDAPVESRTLVAMYLQFLSHGWSAQQRFTLLKFYEKAANRSTDGALPMYMTSVTRDFAESLSEDDLLAILEQGDVWQNAALAAIYKIKRPIDQSTAETLRSLDEKLQGDPDPRDVRRRLRTGIVALLASSDDEDSAEYLRQLWRQEPERRSIIAMALSVHPDGDNWDYLVRSMNILEDAAIDEVVRALRKVPIATDDPTALRHLILLGVRAEEQQLPFENIERLLEHWTGMERPTGGKKSMRPWQKWFSKTYPDRPAAVPPKPDESKWDFEQLVEYLESEKGRYGDPASGKLAYTKAQCAQCHRFGSYGETIGPNLSGIARRFTKREIVESILYPAHVVSDQFASKKILTLDGRVFVGMITEDASGSITIRDSKNQTTVIEGADVDQILPSTSSIMPSGLVDNLTLQEISDMMAYLGALPSAELARKPERD